MNGSETVTWASQGDGVYTAGELCAIGEITGGATREER